jgi:hypothetical protein
MKMHVVKMRKQRKRNDDLWHLRKIRLFAEIFAAWRGTVVDKAYLESCEFRIRTESLCEALLKWEETAEKMKGWNSWRI